MMKFLSSLFRLLCSLLLLIAAALYVNCPGNPDITAYTAQITGENILTIFTSLNWASITAGALVLAALLRLLDIAWNMGFCLSILLVLNAALYFFFGAESLPEAIRHNITVVDFCGLVQSYPVPSLIAAAVFALGWLAASAAFRVAFNTLLCYGLWYICAVIFHEMTAMYAAKPLLPGNAAADSVVTFLLEYPWVCAALPGTFFLVYALLLSFFDSFPATVEKKKADETANEGEESTEAKPAETPAESKAEKPAAAPRPATKAAAAAKPTPTRPLLTPKPVLKKAAAPAAASKPAEAPKAPETPRPTEAPAAPAAEKAPAAPAEQQKPEAAEEKADSTDKPAAPTEEKAAAPEHKAATAAAPETTAPASTEEHSVEKA